MGIGTFTGAGRRSMRRGDVGTSLARQERDQATRYRPGSGGADGLSGRAAIHDANLAIAASRGNRVNSSASCQGSTSSRASAERTLSSMPFLSSPIGANRKLSNSEPRGESEVVRVIPTTEFIAPVKGVNLTTKS
jgi:hypothetical protein